MNDIRLNKVPPELYPMISEYCNGLGVYLVHNGLAEGALSYINYFPGMNQDGTDQVRYGLRDKMGQRRIFEVSELEEYSINYQA